MTHLFIRTTELSRRDKFAIEVMRELVNAYRERHPKQCQDLVEKAVIVADALIDELDKNNKKE